MQSKFFYRHIGAILTLLLTGAFVLWKYWGMLTSLGSMKVLDPYRDGLKTYFNAIWHAQFSPSITLFTGMNYPYVEHIVAATEMPGVAILLRWLEPLIPGISWQVFGIFHAILLLSILVCAWFLFKILNWWELPNWVAIPAALFVTVLAPQNLRMTSHMGLAPLFVIPGAIYLMLRYLREPKVLTALSIGGFIVLVSLFHFYFFAITCIFLGITCFFWSLRNVMLAKTPAISVVRMFAHLMLMFGMPLMLFVTWLVLNDPVEQRNPEPWGFLHYHATYHSIFASPHLPLWKWLMKCGLQLDASEFEGWSYVGLVAGVFSVLFTVWMLVGVIVGRQFLVRHPAKSLLGPMWLVALLSMLLSMSWPFTIPGHESLLDYLGPLKQFRSTGRFAWVFYFVANLLAVSVIYHWVVGWKNRPLGRAFLVLCLTIMGVEAWQFSNSEVYYHNNKLHEIEELQPGKRFSDAAVDWDAYQAVVPLPYYNVGSDHFFSVGGAESVQKSLVLSVQTGVPVTGAMLTRSSPWQAFLQHQLVTEPYRMPAVFDDYPNTKPLLLIFSHVLGPNDVGKWDHLKIFSKPILQGKSWTLYTTELSDFANRIQWRVDSLRSEALNKNTFQAGIFKASADSVAFCYQSLDDFPSEKTYRGGGAVAVSGGEYHRICTDTLTGATANSNYNLSMWLYVKEPLQANATIVLKEYDPAGTELQIRTYGIGFQATVYDPKGWVLVECPFDTKGSSSVFEVGLHWPQAEENQKMWADEVLIKPAEVNLSLDASGVFWWNNRYWKRQDGAWQITD